MSASDVVYAYLHGFASGPASKKGSALRDRFAAHGVALALPDLNRPSFAALTYAGALAAIDDAVGDAPRVRLVGSSMGGWLAAHWAATHPDRVDRVALLCPGFDLVHRWPAIIGPAGMARWRAHGQLAFPDQHGVPTPLHWGFIEDALRYPPTPVTPCPTLILHGVHDDVVPIDGSRAYVAAHAHATLVELDDDHALVASLDRVADAVAEFFALPAAPPRA